MDYNRSHIGIGGSLDAIDHLTRISSVGRFTEIGPIVCLLFFVKENVTWCLLKMKCDEGNVLKESVEFDETASTMMRVSIKLPSISLHLFHGLDGSLRILLQFLFIIQ